MTDRTKNKSKGNRFENATAKLLSKWMFNGDLSILGRHLTSGAIKTAWIGDIVPIKQLPNNFKSFPFLIECKHGYKNNIPTFISYTQIQKWLIKSLKESELSKEQKIIWLIAKFNYQKTILITNYLIDIKLILFTVAIPVIYNNKLIYFYCYILNDLMKYNFFKLFFNKENFNDY